MTTPLYPSESEIAVLVLGKRAKEWSAIARFLTDKEGLPRIDPVMGGRYWPAVEEFFRKWQGMVPVDTANRARIRLLPPKPDGKDNLNGSEASTVNDRRNQNRDNR